MWLGWLPSGVGRKLPVSTGTDKECDRPDQPLGKRRLPAHLFFDTQNPVLKATNFIDLKNFIRTMTILPKEKPNGIKQTRDEGGGKGRGQESTQKSW